MVKLEMKQTSLALGTLFAIMHLVWILTAVIFGNGVLNYMAEMHFVGGNFSVVPFNIGTAIAGLVFAFVFGAVSGIILTLLWNRFG